MSAHFILLYASTIFIASIIPGPSMLLALTHGMKFGARRTLASAMGNVSVTIIQASISIAGLGTVLIASELAYHVIKFVGAIYLLYIGVTLFRAPAISFEDKGKDPTSSESSAIRMFFQAATVTAGNPKAIVFFTAIFPQFIDPTTGYAMQSLLLLTIGATIAFGCFMLYAIGGEKIVAWFSSTPIGKCINKVIGGSFICAGLGLAASNR